MSSFKRIFTVPREERDLVIFLFWRSLTYARRLQIAGVLIVLGLAWQYFSGFRELYGLAFVFAGNLFLLVRGFNNKVDLKAYAPESDWQRMDTDKLYEIVQLDRSMKRWDRSPYDLTNALGMAAFIVFAALMVAAYLLLKDEGANQYAFSHSKFIVSRALEVLVLNAMVLLLPHWFTGLRSIQKKDRLVIKAKVLTAILDHARQVLEPHQVNALVLMRKGAPENVKLKVMPKDSRKGFLGMYCQVVINNVQGNLYPYAYTVIVAEKGYGLKKLKTEVWLPGNVICEYKTERDVEVVVIRQKTSRTSGYHTKDRDACLIFDAGLDNALRWAHRQSAG